MKGGVGRGLPELQIREGTDDNSKIIFSSPGRSPGRAIVLPPAFYLMGKALSGELSCPCDRSCFLYLNKNVCCDPSLEPSWRDGSNDGSQRKF